MTAESALTPEQINWLRTMHKRVARARGRAAEQQCYRCDAQARDWATVHGTGGSDIWADYVALCRSCHIRYDHDARWNEESQAKRRLTVGASIAAAWTPERRAAQSDRARELRRRIPTPQDPITGRFVSS